MTDDPVGRVFFFFVLLVGYFVALRPDLYIKIASYGKRDIRNLSDSYGRGLRVVRIIAGVTALILTMEFAWWLAHSGPH